MALQLSKVSLQKLGVVTQTNTKVTNIENDIDTFKQGDQVQEIASKTILWGAGVKVTGGICFFWHQFFLAIAFLAQVHQFI